MTGMDAARAIADKIRQENEQEQIAEEMTFKKVEESMPVRVERSGELLKNNGSTMAVAGLEDVPTSMIPVPFYKLVQPGSTGITKSDGTDAVAGNFFMGDTADEISSLRFLLLRAKRQTRQIIDDNGNPQQTLTMAVLGLNLTSMTPFILSVPVSSFTNFGTLLGQYKARKVQRAWDFPITATTEKQEVQKQTTRGLQMTKFWTINFLLENEPVSQDELALAEGAYREFAAKLDRNAPVAEVTDTKQEPIIDDIPF